ncbi:MAG: hypothetical protein HY028_03340 [Gammaproteobacteria bacterium]|nr:hypothetical protein [Gammaproteobacteria bacterium]
MQESFIAQLAAGHITWSTGLVWIMASFLIALLGGAAAGVKLAGKSLGDELAALMGAMFGPTGAVPAILLGLILLKFI